MRLLTALLCIVLALRAAPAMAQTDIHRCIDASGDALFTDQPCATLHATTTRAAARPADDTDNATIATVPAEPPPILCAATFDALRQSVIDAFASRNANRLAGLMLWNGYGNGDAVGTIRALNALMQQPLLDAGPPDNTGMSASAGAGTLTAEAARDAPAAGNQLVLHLAGSDGSGNPRELRYDIVHRAGCLWLRPAAAE